MIRLDKVKDNPISVIIKEADVVSGEFRELGALASAGLNFGTGEVYDVDAVGTTAGATVVVLAPVQMDKVWDMNEADYTIANGEVVRAYILESGDIITISSTITVPAEAKLVQIGTDSIMGINCNVYRML